MVSMSSEGRIGLGSRVVVRGFVPGADIELQFVASEEVDYRSRKVPLRGPLASALVGAQTGDRVTMTLLEETLELTVLEVQRN